MITNRDYFSWSQYSLWKSSKLSFRKKYVLGEESKTNKYFEKGKEFSGYMETGEIPHYADPLLETVGNITPRLDLMEHEIRVPCVDNMSEFPWAKELLMYSDTAKEDGSVFYEYKTGKVPWTQDLVDKHEQLDFYGLLYYLKYGKIPDCKLIWIETEEVEEQGQTVIRYTGHIEEFTRVLYEEDISKMMVDIYTSLQEIYEYEYSELQLENELVDRYIKITDEMKKLKSEAEIIKLEVQTRMEADDVQYALTEAGKFSVSKRKYYKYSKELETLKQKYAKEIKDKETKERKDRTAIESYTTSIRFLKTKN